MSTALEGGFGARMAGGLSFGTARGSERELASSGEGGDGDEADA